MMLMLEPGTGEALEIPVSVAGFHNNELVDHAEAALASAFFADWRRSQPPGFALEHGLCAGYRVPLFLGGQDTVDNLEVIAVDVYWQVCGQLIAATRELPPRRQIGALRCDFRS
jgi:hypothetical protein